MGGDSTGIGIPLGDRLDAGEPRGIGLPLGDGLNAGDSTGTMLPLGIGLAGGIVSAGSILPIGSKLAPMGFGGPGSTGPGPMGSWARLMAAAPSPIARTPTMAKKGPLDMTTSGSMSGD